MSKKLHSLHRLAHVFPKVGLRTAKRRHPFLKLVVFLLGPRPPVEHLAFRRRGGLFRRPSSDVGGGSTRRCGQEVAVQRAGRGARLLSDPADIGRRARGVIIRPTGREKGPILAGRSSLTRLKKEARGGARKKRC